MTTRPGRNDPCPCGSGLKYKRCHMLEAPPLDIERRIQPELEAEVMHRVLDKHYREWIDIRLPALDDHTPRYAATKKVLRPKLIALLNDFDRHTEQDRRAGRPSYDFGWMWAELRIPEELRVSPPGNSAPAERLEMLVNEPNVKYAREMMNAIRRELDHAPNPGPWLAAVRELETRGVIGRDAVCYFAEIFLECTTQEASVSDAELCRIHAEMQAIERAHGLAEDEDWYIDEGTPEWQALGKEWDKRADALVNAQLRALGHHDLADLREGDPDEFADRGERGRAELFGEAS